MSTSSITIPSFTKVDKVITSNDIEEWIDYNAFAPKISLDAMKAKVTGNCGMMMKLVEEVARINTKIEHLSMLTVYDTTNIYTYTPLFHHIRLLTWGVVVV
jgi:hypothetical protein